MPTTIIIRIDDDNHAFDALAVGAKDMAKSFLPDIGIKPSRVTITYRTPEDEAKAVAGSLNFAERRSQWP